MNPFYHITTEELPLLAKTLKKETISDDGTRYPERSNEDTLETLELIDDLLSIRKSKSLMMKKRGYQVALSKRIEQYLKEKS